MPVFSTFAAQLLAVQGVFALFISAHAQVAPPAVLPDDRPPLQIEVKELQVPVIVRDAGGKEVRDLTEANFQVFDEGKLRTISGFTVLHFPGTQAPAHPAAQTNSESGPPPPATDSPVRSVVFLFDDRHFGPANLIETQRAAVQMLDRSLGPSDRAVVLSFFGTNSGLTSNRALLAAAIQKIKAHQPLNATGDCPDIDYYSADQIVNKHNDTQFQIEFEKAANCSHKSSKTDAGYVEIMVREGANRSLQLGEQDAIATLGYMRDVIHSIEQLPGQRILVLVSPGFLNYSSQGMSIESQILNMAAAKNIIVSAIDTRGLGSAIMGANQAGSGSVFSQITGQTQRNASGSSEENDDVMAELASGTGGNFVRGSNDLAGGLAQLTEAPETMYLLSVSLQGLKQNGNYHRLRVRVDREKVTVQARQGYFSPKGK